MSKKAYSFHPETGEYFGPVECQPSPLEFGSYFLPACATFTKPPKQMKEKSRHWTGQEWEYRDIPKEDPK